MRLVSDQSLSWYQSSASAERGFCQRCGSSLFWRPVADEHVSIMAGTLDETDGMGATGHIYVEFKADYYDLNDGLPQCQRYDAATLQLGAG